MKKLLLGTLLGASLSLSPSESISNMNHLQILNDIKARTHTLLELKKQEKRTRISKIQKAIDDDIDKDESRVLLVGINDYKFVDGLETPVNDVKMMKKFLMKKYGIKKENIVVLLDKNATKQKILEEMQKLEKLTPDDKKMIIYFSGHGIALDDKGREVLNYKGKNYTGYITPYDAINYSKKKKNNLAFMQTRISRQEINNILGFKQNDLIILDSCFGGAMLKNSQNNEVLVTASNKEEAITTRKARHKTSLFSEVIFEELSQSNNKLGQAVINSGLAINKEATIQKSEQEPLVKTKEITYNLRRNKEEELN